MPVVPIQSADDPRLAAYREIRERDLTGRNGLFIAEGRVVLEKLIRARPDALSSLLVAAHRLESLSGLLAGVPAATPIYAASQAAMDLVVGFPMHRGILAVGRKPQPDLAGLLAGLSPRALVVGLIGIANHDNMGGILRNAAAFGVDAVLLDETCCDPFYRKSIRVSVGAALTLPIATAGSARALVETLQTAGFEVVALSPAGSVALDDLVTGARTAILFGAEGPGLPATVLDQVQTVRIDMSGGFDSLNVATTSGIVLHRLSGPRHQSRRTVLTQALKALP